MVLILSTSHHQLEVFSSQFKRKFIAWLTSCTHMHDKRVSSGKTKLYQNINKNVFKIQYRIRSRHQKHLSFRLFGSYRARWRWHGESCATLLWRGKLFSVNAPLNYLQYSYNSPSFRIIPKSIRVLAVRSAFVSIKRWTTTALAGL